MCMCSCNDLHDLFICWWLKIMWCCWLKSKELKFPEGFRCRLGAFAHVVCPRRRLGCWKSIACTKFARSRIPLRVSSELNSPLRLIVEKWRIKCVYITTDSRPAVHIWADNLQCWTHNTSCSNAVWHVNCSSALCVMKRSEYSNKWRKNESRHSLKSHSITSARCH